jgi:hypothetical protein
MGLRLGLGFGVMFVWRSDLDEAFPVLFSITQYKKPSMAVGVAIRVGFESCRRNLGLSRVVADHMLFSNSTFHWNITFIISVHEWEMEMVTLFFNLLYSLSV